MTQAKTTGIFDDTSFLVQLVGRHTAWTTLLCESRDGEHSTAATFNLRGHHLSRTVRAIGSGDCTFAKEHLGEPFGVDIAQRGASCRGG